jgi:hypothetical protein
MNPLLSIQHRADRLHGRYQPAGNLAVDFFKTIGAKFGLIQLMCEPCAVDMDPLDLIIDLARLPLPFDTHIDGIFEICDGSIQLRQRRLYGLLSRHRFFQLARHRPNRPVSGLFNNHEVITRFTIPSIKPVH